MATHRNVVFTCNPHRIQVTATAAQKVCHKSGNIQKPWFTVIAVSIFRICYLRSVDDLVMFLTCPENNAKISCPRDNAPRNPVTPFVARCRTTQNLKIRARTKEIKLTQQGGWSYSPGKERDAKVFTLGFGCRRRLTLKCSRAEGRNAWEMQNKI